MDQPKIERTLRLMKMMSYRSVYRYIDTFKASGFVIEKLQKNIYKVGKMPRSHVDMSKFIYFCEEEAYLVNSMIDGLYPTNQIKINLKKKFSAIYSCTSIANYVHSENAASNIQDLEKAIKEKKKVILKAYESANSKGVSDRFVEPFEFTTNCSDICGYDLEKNECRVFKISRINSVVVLEDYWTNVEQDVQSCSSDDCRDKERIPQGSHRMQGHL